MARLLVHMFLSAALAAPAFAGPLDEAMEHCVQSDAPHPQRLADLKTAGWTPMDDAGAIYAAYGSLISGLTEAPLSNTAFWQNVETHFAASVRYADAQKKYLLAAKSGPSGTIANLQKNEAILRIYSRTDDKGAEFHCGYQQPEPHDVSRLPTDVLAPPYKSTFSIGTVIESLYRKVDATGALTETTHVMQVIPDMDHLRSLAPEYPQIGYAFSSFVGKWEGPND